jgi:hypothetical protein
MEHRAVFEMPRIERMLGSRAFRACWKEDIIEVFRKTLQLAEISKLA